MPAAWTTPRTWTAGELVTAAIGNSAWRDNLMYLKDSPTFDGSVTVTGTIAGAAMTLSSTLGVTGATTLSSTVATGALTVTGAATVSTTLGVTGATTLSSTVATGALTITGAATYTTSLKSTTALATPAALTATQATAFASTVSGAAIMGFGTTNDVSLMNRAGTVVLGVGPNTTAVNMVGTLSVAGLTTLSATGDHWNKGSLSLGPAQSASIGAGDLSVARSATTAYLNFGSNGTVNLALASSVLTLNGAMMTKPAQPAFLATAAAQANVTGDGTLYTVTFTNEIFDQANNFASSTFTAPVTGRYQLNVSLVIGGFTTSHAYILPSLVASNRTIQMPFQRDSEYIANDQWSGCFAVLMDMDAGDTAIVKFLVSNATKVIDVQATDTTFSGYLVA